MKYYEIEFKHAKQDVRGVNAFTVYHNDPNDERVVKFSYPFIVPETDIPYLLHFGEGIKCMFLVSAGD